MLYLVLVSHPNTLSCVCGGVSVVWDLCENTLAPQPTGALVKLKYIDFRYSPQQKKNTEKVRFPYGRKTRVLVRTWYYIGHDLHDLLPKAGARAKDDARLFNGGKQLPVTILFFTTESR